MKIEPGLQRVFVQDPEIPEKLHPASLEIVKGKTLTLTFDVILDPKPDWLGKNQLKRLNIAHPYEVTCFDLLLLDAKFYEKYVYQSQISFSEIHESKDEAKFQEVYITVSGCSTWIGLHGFEYKNVRRGKKNITEIIHQPVEEQEYFITELLSYKYRKDSTLNINRDQNDSVQIRETSVLEIRSKAKQTFHDLMSEARKIVAFIEFATDNSLLIDHVKTFQSLDKDDYGHDVYANWKNNPEFKSGYHWLFMYPIVQPNMGDHLKKWFSLYDAIPLALDLYRGKHTNGLQVEFRLFSIISALESFHRSIFGEGTIIKCTACKRKSGMSLDQRLKEIVKKHGSHIQELLTKQDCQKIANTRNYLAHQTPELLSRSIPPDEWFYWYRRLTMVFEICILAELPFAHQDALDTIISNRWKSIRSGSLGDWNL